MTLPSSQARRWRGPVASAGSRGSAALADAVSGADLVVEAVVEDLAVKRDVFAAVSATAPDAVLATNTSVLPVTEIAAGALRPELVLGTHWWNPPDLIPVVEVVQAATAADLPGRMMTLLGCLGKTPVLVRRDVPGFIGNRLQHALWREAIAMVAEGICDAETVDLVARNTIGLRLARMGPLENADYVGLDLTLAIHKAVLPSLCADSEPSPLLAALVRRGDLGARTGHGFLPWDPQARPRAAAGARGASHRPGCLAGQPGAATRLPTSQRGAGDPPLRPGPLTEAQPVSTTNAPLAASARQSTAERNTGMTFRWPSSPKESGLEFFDLSHPWGHGVPAWPYFEDVKIERLHGMAKSRVLTQKITTVMHSGTHIDAPGHVVEGTPLLDEIPLSAFFGTGVVVSIPKKKWEVVTPDDLEAARPEIQPGDIVIVNTGWHHHYSDSAQYYAYSPGFYKEAGEWFAAARCQGGRHRHPGARPSAGHRHRPARSWRGTRAACCPGRSPSTRRRPAAWCGTTSPNGSRATGPSCPTASTASRTSAVTWTR